MTCSKATPRAKIEWIEGKIPWSSRFGDSYYSRIDGKEEASHVFVEGNQLPQRWRQMKKCRIAELGFGTGLNFLETLRRHRESAEKDSELHFVSFEKFPLEAGQIEIALSKWKELERDKKRLLRIWSESPQGVDAIFSPNVRLTVHFGDANLLLPRKAENIDAWYLDGFAPDRNPDLWSESLMRKLHESTRSGGTFATYSAAGSVRRNLQAAGFAVERASGFAGKRHMTKGFKP